ncbi:hypothetical protein ABZ617_02855 [Nocardiopsis alba]|uniref:hypothetical protein n=1 Tax=Nocardiopsis alba TaxID=53437 RepID=UPI0033C4E851
MNYTTTDQKVARFMEADYEETDQWRTLNLNDVVSATDLTTDQANESVLRLGDGGIIETVRASKLEGGGLRRVSTFGKLSEEGRLLAQSR